MFISTENQSTVNTEHLCHFDLEDKKILFYFDTMTARENWKFDTEKEAESVFQKIKALIDAKNL